MGTLAAKKTPKVLIVPHQPHRGIRFGRWKIARHLAQSGMGEVYVLTWQAAKPAQGLWPKLARRLGEAWRSASTPSRITPDEKTPHLHWVEMPYLLTPNGLCQLFNQRRLGEWIAREQIDVVINASAYHFPVPESRACYVYDVVDDHLSENSGPHWRQTRRFTLAECGKADYVMAISHGLQAALKEHGVANTIYVPNGVDYSSSAKADPVVLARLRQQYGLENRFVLAYVGNHGWWSGTEFLLKVFQKLHAQVPNSTLFIVGPGEDAERCQKAYESEHIIFTGPVSPTEATAFFHLSSLGVLPFSLCPFTHNALPLKILEYGVAKKRMLASPLHELEQLRFPHVTILPLEESAWVSAIVEEARQPVLWQPGWDDVLARYDWPRVLRPLDEVIEKAGDRA